MDEEAIRAAAHQRNDGGRDPLNPGRDKHYRAMKGSKLLGDPLFRDKVALYIDSIPLNPVELKHCPGCEGVLCEVCGKCHDLDRKLDKRHPNGEFVSLPCPAMQHMHQNDGCVAWTYAYVFLRDADKQAVKD